MEQCRIRAESVTERPPPSPTPSIPTKPSLFQKLHIPFVLSSVLPVDSFRALVSTLVVVLHPPTAGEVVFNQLVGLLSLSCAICLGSFVDLLGL